MVIVYALIDVGMARRTSRSERDHTSLLGDVARSLPVASRGAMATRVLRVRTEMAVSKPKRGAEAIRCRVPASDWAISSQVATSVEPFQVAYAVT